jgi:hypothetical protein
MGLIEKRLIKLGREEWVPAAQKELQEVTGCQPVYDVDWDSFSSDETALNNVQNQGMRRITSAFRVICSDELGKEAVAEQVKRVVLRNVDDPSKKGITVADGAVTVQCAWGKGDAGYFTDREIQLIIERML